MRVFKFLLLLNKLVMKRLIVNFSLYSSGLTVSISIYFYVFGFLNKFINIELDFKYCVRLEEILESHTVHL